MVAHPGQANRAVTRGSNHRHITFEGQPWLRIGEAKCCDEDGLLTDRAFAEDELIIRYTGQPCSSSSGRVSVYVFKPRTRCSGLTFEHACLVLIN